ncbi:cytochrome P450 [Xylariaceae sp. FL0662B]|nr:cytochrome P450 [Xylariaceae sp. FL0662B]
MMSSPSGLPSMGMAWDQWMLMNDTRFSSYVLIGFMAMITAYVWISSNNHLKGVPLINPPGFFSNTEAKKLFMTSAESLIAQAREKYPNQPYRLMTDTGEMIVLPPRFIDEIRNESGLSFADAMEEARIHVRPSNLDGFEPIGSLSNDQVLQAVVRKHVAKLYAKAIEPLADETKFAIYINMGDSLDWQEMKMKDPVLDIVSRITSRVFLGNQLCRNEAWLKMLKKYAVDVFIATNKLNMYPRPMRRFMNRVLPECNIVRAEHEEARQIISPTISQRQELKKAAIAAGQELPSFNDALDWLEEEAAAKGSGYDAATFQLAISLVAIHTSADLLHQAMIDLAQHPESTQKIREEIISVLRAEGWTSSALYSMKLLDSALKETQRMKPIDILLLRRKATKDVQLSNGLTLKKGTRTWVERSRMADPAVYENPDEWDAARFLKMRSRPDRMAMAQLVSTSHDHYGFGHGAHACPGRFFAANEIKIALCQLLLRYEWKMAPGSDVRPVVIGTSYAASPTSKLLIRRREEVGLDVGWV